jgi:hypothetical protein
MYRHRRGNWLRGLLLFMAVTAAVMVAGLAVNAHFSPPQKPQALPPADLPTPPWDVTASPSASPAAASEPTPASVPALAGPVQVVQGAQLVNGVYLGFPHSTLGAVSAADEFATLVVSTLDPDRSAAVMRLVADPSYADGPQQAAQGTVNDRKALGLPAGGPVPPGYSFDLVAEEYQVQDAAPDAVTVLLLSDFISATPAQGSTIGIGVFPVALHWSAGDWKVLPAPGKDYAGLAAEPGSPQAASLGWQDLEA